MNHCPDSGDRRSKSRKVLSSPIKAKFRLEIDAEVSDISEDGLAIRFSTIEQGDLAAGKKLILHLDMNGKMVSLEGEVKQISRDDQSVTVGVKYNRDQLAVFSSR